MSEIGKILIIIGILITGVGIYFVFEGKVPFQWLGRLPGDFTFKGKNVTFYLPLSTSLIVSIILTLILWLINRK